MEKQFVSSPAGEKESTLFVSLKELAEKKNQTESDIVTAKTEIKTSQSVVANSKLEIQTLLSKVFEKNVLLTD